MTSQSKSKAQRRAENQRNAAEKRAAEQRAKRMRIGIRIGGAVVVVALVVVLIVRGDGRFEQRHAAHGQEPPHRARAHSRPPCPPRGCSRRPGRRAPRPSRSRAGRSWPRSSTRPRARPSTASSARPTSRLVLHVHTHLTIFVNGKAQVIPYGIGIPGFQAVSTAQGPFVQTGSCFYWLHVHANDGIIHIESPSTSGHLHPGPVLRRVGHPAQQDAGRPGHGQRHGLLHLAGPEGEALHGQPQRTSRWATTTRFSSTSARRSWRPSRSPTGAGCKVGECGRLR